MNSGAFIGALLVHGGGIHARFLFSAFAGAPAMQLTHEGGVKFPAYLESMLWVYGMGHVPMLYAHDMGNIVFICNYPLLAFGSSVDSVCARGR